MASDPLVAEPYPLSHRNGRALSRHGVESAGTKSRPWGFSLICYALWLSLALAGCQARGTYDAASLPSELRVAQASDATEVNLTRLAGPGASSTRIGAGDLLELTVATGHSTSGETAVLVRVDEQGLINVPLVGQVAVGDLEPDEAEQNVAAAAVQRGLYRQPYVTLTVKRQRTNRVTVVGSVETPGTYELPRGSSDMLGALAAAGGLSEDAGIEVEVLRKNVLPNARPGPTLPGPGQPLPNGQVAGSLTSYEGPPTAPSAPTVLRVNLEQVSQGQTGDFRLGDGDVVMVHTQQPRVVHVLGLVRRPGQYEIPYGKDVYLLDALALAGGRTIQVADKVTIIRRTAESDEPIVVNASVRKAKKEMNSNMRLGPGDLVSVEETPATFLLETVRSFVRFGFSAAAPIF